MWRVPLCGRKVTSWVRRYTEWGWRVRFGCTSPHPRRSHHPYPARNPPPTQDVTSISPQHVTPRHHTRNPLHIPRVTTPSHIGWRVLRTEVFIYIYMRCACRAHSYLCACVSTSKDAACLSACTRMHTRVQMCVCVVCVCRGSLVRVYALACGVQVHTRTLARVCTYIKLACV